MKKMGIYSCVAGAAAVVCIVSVWGLKCVTTKRMSADAIDTVLEEASDSSVDQIETENSNSEPETEQRMYKSPMTDEDYELLFATRSFAESVEDYVVYKFQYQGEEPQTEIVWDFEDPGDIPQTAVAVTEETIDLMSMTRAVCAIEYFCGGTDFHIIDTYYVYVGAVVRFEHDGHEYTCVEANHVSFEMQICDAVFETCPTASGNSKRYEPDEIKITEPDGGLIELRETAKAFIQSAGDYVIYEYEYRGGRPEKNWRHIKPTVDYETMNRALCAIEDFCGGTSFRIVDTYYAGSGGSVQFVRAGHEYTCISEACVADEIKICDAVFEVHSAAGVNSTTPGIPDEIKVRDEEGVFHTLLTY